jgi:hypothetical protein
MTLGAGWKVLRENAFAYPEACAIAQQEMKIPYKIQQICLTFMLGSIEIKREEVEQNSLRNSVGRQDDIQNVIDQFVLQNSVINGCWREWWRGINFDEPGFQIIINNYVVTVALETMSIRCHNWLHCFQWMHNQPIDATK